MKRASVALAFAALSFTGCQHYEDFILPTVGGTDEEKPVQLPDESGDRRPGDSLYPAYTSEYLAPFRENFGDETLPPVHLYFQDQNGNALVDLDFDIFRESDGAGPRNPSVTDGSGFWFDEDFAADPGVGRYLVLAGEDTASFHYDGSDRNPAIYRFTFRMPEPASSWNFPGVSQTLIESARASYRGEGVPVVILYVHESGNPKSSFTASVTTDIPGCDLPVVDQRSTNGSGFTFLMADELCGNGEYLLDLRQGGYYDTFCGPDSDSFIYEGEPVWVDVDVWCE